MAKFAQGRFAMKYPDKYVGGKTPLYRSSWEFAFMRFCDESPSISKWASESIKIPYKHPLNGKFSVYVPDFFIAYVDKNGRQHADVIEIKPENQTKMESVGRNRYNQAQLIINQAKWKSARLWCKNRGFSFKVINEADIFHTGSKR
tara:strand:+ start:3085 stop:3522 length:438 start_codon:yes stop_codon:yes gene_type:complete